MNNKVFVLSLDGCEDQIVLAQSRKELAYRLYGMKLDKPNQQLFLDPLAKITFIGTLESANKTPIFHVGKEGIYWSVTELVNEACSDLSDRANVEVLPNERNEE